MQHHHYVNLMRSPFAPAELSRFRRRLIQRSVPLLPPQSSQLRFVSDFLSYPSDQPTVPCPRHDFRLLGLGYPRVLKVPFKTRSQSPLKISTSSGSVLASQAHHHFIAAK